MLTGRKDIIGDLARLNHEFMIAVNDTEDLLVRLEILAAAAVQLGMSYNIVEKASGIPPERVHAVLDARSRHINQAAQAYERHPTGTVHRRPVVATEVVTLRLS